jgi:hypothetical protein
MRWPVGLAVPFMAAAMTELEAPKSMLTGLSILSQRQYRTVLAISYSQSMARYPSS